MRIAVYNWSGRKAGGVETYIQGIMAEQHRRGHALAFAHELDTPENRERIALPEGVPAWCLSESGPKSAIAALESWNPDVIFMQGCTRPDWIAETVARVPTVFFCHDYVGTCISGNKAFQFPMVQPCDRRFGPACLLHYFPHRCGGWSPATMWNDFRKQSRRLDLVRSCKAVVTASDAMREEYLKHGLDPASVHLVATFAMEAERPMHAAVEPSRLLFVARMERLKGGGMFLEALPRVQEALGRSLHVTFASDGRARAEWEKKASQLNMPVEFTGWLTSRDLEKRMAESDLLVVPSLWPEPFGSVGLEAGRQGLPAAAFAVGGIPDWLHEGVNGCLAPSNPPTAAGLAEAIVRCLRDPGVHSRLRSGAYETASRFSLDRHTEKVMKVLETAAHAH